MTQELTKTQWVALMTDTPNLSTTIKNILGDRTISTVQYLNSGKIFLTQDGNFYYLDGYMVGKVEKKKEVAAHDLKAEIEEYNDLYQFTDKEIEEVTTSNVAVKHVSTDNNQGILTGWFELDGTDYGTGYIFDKVIYGVNWSNDIIPLIVDEDNYPLTAGDVELIAVINSLKQEIEVP